MKGSGCSYVAWTYSVSREPSSPLRSSAYIMLRWLPKLKLRHIPYIWGVERALWVRNQVASTDSQHRVPLVPWTCFCTRSAACAEGVPRTHRRQVEQARIRWRGGQACASPLLCRFISARRDLGSLSSAFFGGAKFIFRFLLCRPRNLGSA